jgi:hypothetical protein
VEDVACRVIAAHQQPDHATIARFVERHELALAGLFGEVLWLCADAGLVSVGVLAVDGTKVAASANRDRTMDYEQIAREIVEQQIQTDRAETAEHGERRGDELPEEIKTGEGRRKYLAAARQRLERERAERAAPVPRSRAKRLVDARRAWKKNSPWSNEPTMSTRPIASAIATRPVADWAPPRSPISRQDSPPGRST